jgi:hypothetical protein
VVRALEAAGITGSAVEQVEPTLEDAFVRAAGAAGAAQAVSATGARSSVH